MHNQEQGITVGQHNVMVRAFQDEPVRLVAVAGNSVRVEVAGASQDVTLRFPASYVYDFDPNLFKELKDAWDRRDSGVLKSLWRKASHANLGPEESP